MPFTDPSAAAQKHSTAGPLYYSLLVCMLARTCTPSRYCDLNSAAAFASLLLIQPQCATCGHHHAWKIFQHLSLLFTLMLQKTSMFTKSMILAGDYDHYLLCSADVWVCLTSQKEGKDSFSCPKNWSLMTFQTYVRIHNVRVVTYESTTTNITLISAEYNNDMSKWLHRTQFNISGRNRAHAAGLEVQHQIFLLKDLECWYILLWVNII